MRKKVEAALAQLSGMTGINNSLDPTKQKENRKLNIDDSIELDTGKSIETNKISPIQQVKAPIPKPKMEVYEPVKQPKHVKIKKKIHKKHKKRLEEKKRKKALREKKKKRKLMKTM